VPGFSTGGVRLQAPLDQEPFHTWTMPDGSIWTEFHRLPDRYLLRFPGLADFEISRSDLAVVCRPTAGTNKSTLQHLYLNQVQPLVLSKQGQLVFHGSAVDVGQAAVAFIAASGRGKSTMAASFATSGYPFLTDDGLVLESRSAGYVVLPSHPSLRLWEDSEEALLAAGTPRAPAVEYTSKARLLPGEALPFCDQPRHLAMVCFLGDAEVEDTELVPLTPSEALAEWTRHSFLLDIEEKPRLAAHFRDVSALALQPIHYRLDYPRDYSLLPSVRSAILDRVTASVAGP
jgi:hypothetical protein